MQRGHKCKGPGADPHGGSEERSADQHSWRAVAKSRATGPVAPEPGRQVKRLAVLQEVTRGFYRLKVQLRD